MPNRSRGLTTLLALVISMAILPLGIISLYQTWSVIRESQELGHAALMAETLAAAAAESQKIHAAAGAGIGLAANAGRGDGVRCGETLTQFIADDADFVFAGLTGPQGNTLCTSGNATIDVSRDAQPDKEGDEGVDRRIRVTLVPKGANTSTPLMLVTRPLFRAEEHVGAVSVATRLSLSAELIEDSNQRPDASLMAVSRDGQIIANGKNDLQLEMILPVGMTPERLIRRTGETFRATAMSGHERIYAVGPVIPGEMVVVGSWSEANSTLVASAFNRAMAMVFPILMWVASVGVAVYGARRLVVRHVRTLQSAMRRYALGHRDDAPVVLDGAPEELRDAERSFNRMALVLGDAEEQAKRDLADKEVLLREVHHRVKNNLQFIASIMNIQSRKAQSEEAKDLLAGLQRRVKGLATMHRSLYSSTEMGHMDAGQLIGSLVRDLSEIASDDVSGEYELETDLHEALIYPDQAAPLAMLLAEGLTNALKYADAGPGEKARVKIRFDTLNGTTARLELSNSRNPLADPDAEKEFGGGMGTRLMGAFVDQLEGTSEITETNESYTYRVDFPLRGFDPDAAELPPMTQDG